MTKLMRYGREELERAGAVGFSIDSVLRRSGVARSSLYHHFQSRDGLIVALEFERAYEETLREMETLRLLVLQSPDVDTVLKTIELGLVTAGKESGALQRRQRVQTLAASYDSPGLRRLLGDAQVAGSRHLSETLRLAVEKGIFAIDQPIDGVAYLMQSMFVGRVLVDLAHDEALDAAWVSTAMSVFRHLLRPA